MSARGWTLTINNYNRDDENLFVTLPKGVRYAIAGYEVGKEGTPHLQCYIEMFSPCRFTAVKKLYPRAHIEVRRGTRDEARNYCLKDGIAVEIGDWEAGGRGARPDLDRARQCASEGGMRLVTQVCNAQQIRVAEKFLEHNEECRDWKPEVTWIWGPTGCGKSFTARKILEDEDIYTKNNGTKWWTHYDGHPAVIIDDFRDSWWSLTDTLALLDRYEYVVECKGGARQFLAKKIVITSCKHPSECYKGVGEDIQQLIRRIDDIRYMGEKYVPEDNVTKSDNLSRSCHEVKLDDTEELQMNLPLVPLIRTGGPFCHEVGKGNTESLPDEKIAGALPSLDDDDDIIYEDNIYDEDEEDKLTFDDFYKKFGYMPI